MCLPSTPLVESTWNGNPVMSCWFGITRLRSYASGSGLVMSVLSICQLGGCEFAAEEALFYLGTLSPNPWDFSLSRRMAAFRGADADPPFRPLGRRSGRIPALPYPPPSLGHASRAEKIQIKKNLPDPAPAV